MLYSRCAPSTSEIAKAISNFTNSKQVRPAFLLILVPSEMDNIVENLLMKVDLFYTDIHAQLIDLAANKSMESTTADTA
jgi:hypothetical protein